MCSTNLPRDPPRNLVAFLEYAKEISVDLIFELKSRHSVAELPPASVEVPRIPHTAPLPTCRGINLSVLNHLQSCCYLHFKSSTFNFISL